MAGPNGPGRRRVRDGALVQVHLFLLAARLVFGAVFLWAAWGKILDTDQFALQVARYQIIGPGASALVAVVVPWAEFMIGACLFIGVCTASAWLGAVILFAVFAFARASVLHRGLSIECGCGVMDGVITVRSLVASIALLFIAIAGYIAQVLGGCVTGLERIAPARSVRPEGALVGGAKECPCGATATRGERFDVAQPIVITEPSSNRGTLVIPTHAGNAGHLRRAAIGAIVAAALCLPGSAWGQAMGSAAERVRLEGCRSQQAAFDRIVSAHRRDADTTAVERRLAAMDEAADAVLQQMRLRQDALLDQSLATVEGREAANGNRPLDAGTIVRRYQGTFATSILLQKFPENERQILRQYVQTACHSLSAAIASRGRRCIASAGVDAGEVERLAFVLTTLASDPDQALSAPAPALPKWMSDASAIGLLQTFALECERPRLAFALAHSATTQPAGVSVAYAAFARQQADALLRAQQYQAAVFCLRDAIAVADAAKDETGATDLTFRIGDVLEMMDSPDAAADEMARVRSHCGEAADFSRASALRLKYLYEAGQDQEVVAEAKADECEPRCTANLAELMYAGWLASSRTPKAGSADEWSKAFLERFSDHPLAVHLYFAAVTRALATGNTGEASRLLSFIDSHFPQSRMIDQVHRIEARLGSAPADGAPDTP